MPMKIKLQILAISLLALHCSGCVKQFAGNKSLSDQKAVSSIVEGKTTKAQVEQLLGQPSQTSYMTGVGEMWSYYQVNAHQTGAAFIPLAHLFTETSFASSKSLMIVFNKRGIVTRVNRNNTSTHSDNGGLHFDRGQ